MTEQPEQSFEAALERLIDEWLYERRADPWDVIDTLADYAASGKASAKRLGIKPGTLKRKADK